MVCVLVVAGWTFIDYLTSRPKSWLDDEYRMQVAFYTLIIYLLGSAFGYVYRAGEERFEAWRARKNKKKWKKFVERKQSLSTGGT